MIELPSSLDASRKITIMAEILNPENPVFRAYAFWAGVLVLKVLAMAIFTSQARGKKKVRFS